MLLITGLTALRSEEVYDLMLKDYPEKYQVNILFIDLLID